MLGGASTSTPEGLPARYQASCKRVAITAVERSFPVRSCSERSIKAAVLRLRGAAALSDDGQRSDGQPGDSPAATEESALAEEGHPLPDMTSEFVRLVMVRHGTSIWNRDNRFTAWMDVPLSEQGLDDARKAAKLCKTAGISFDVAFTSVLQRAIKTCHMILEEIGQLWVPTVCDWRLNERHDGALTGLNKKMAVVMYGEKNVSTWRRSYAVPPPPLQREHP